MFTPWNSFSACLGCRNARVSVECLNLVHQGGVIPLGPAPWNSFSVCLLAKNDRIGRARLDLVNQGHVNPLGLEVHRESGGFTPWSATIYSTGTKLFY